MGRAGYALKQTDARYVCFVNKRHFNAGQIPVQVNNRTYYACCDSCRKRLLEDAGTRMDKDPVSGRPVDKAMAAIGLDRAGNVYFFENAGNLKQFRATAEPEATFQHVHGTR